MTVLKKCSIIIPVYQNEGSLKQLHTRLLDLKKKLDDLQFELIFVNDGSTDRSLAVLQELKQSDQDIKIIKLTRNFGSMAAIQAGLNLSSGDCAAMLSADLQDPPELLEQMAEHWKNGFKTVFCVRRGRKDPISSKIFSKVYYWLLRKYGIKGYPPGGFDFFLLDKQVVDHLRMIQEKNTDIRALIFWLGYEYKEVPYMREERVYGKSQFTFAKKLRLFLDSFVAFSYAPVRLMSVVGIIASIIATSAAIYTFYFASTADPTFWIGITLIFISGIQMLFVGIIGEYLWRTLDASRKRPHFVVDETYQ